MDNTRFSNPELEDRSLAYLKTKIEKLFEGDPLSCKEADPAVIIDKLQSTGVDPTHRLDAKIRILRFLQEHSIQDLLEDPVRTVYAVEVMNNEDSMFVDPEFLPSVTALELAYFIQQLKQLGGLDKPENVPHEFKKVCSYVLSEEGFYEAPFPFVFLSKDDLFPVYFTKEEIPATDKEIQSAKQEGIDKYLQLMSKLDL